MRTDSWFDELFRQWPDLILRLVGNLTPEQRRITGYRFTAPVLKASEHRPDGVLLPPEHHPELPVVILEAQMFPDSLFFHRLITESMLYLRQHPQVMRWQAVVLVPEAGLQLGPTEPFEEVLERRVSLVSLEELSRRPGLDPPEELLTLVVRPEGELRPTSRGLLSPRPELTAMVATILWARLPHLSLEEIMTFAGVRLAEISESRAYKDIIAIGHQEGVQEGRQEGLREGKRDEALSLVLRQLKRRFGSLSDEWRATLGNLSTEDLEALAEALLDFQSEGDLEEWLAGRQLG